VLCWLRTRSGLTQQELANKIGKGRCRSWMTKFENGTATPTVMSLHTIADALGVTVAKIMLACEYLMKDDSRVD
jgi:transcriptional regulator with XRE-family HTH domain